MAGVYIHIPFCKKICYYCDFYKSANYRYVDDFMVALLKEISLKKDLAVYKIDTIYFGGGTPSSISVLKIERILKQIKNNFELSDKAEITFEINPDDVDLSYLKSLRLLGVNRLSIGIQSFNDDILKYINRRHNAQQAITVIQNAKDAGFDNISIDLIYGIPKQNIDHFMADLKLFKSFKLKHLSAYHLTIEQKTQFGRMLKKAEISEISETESLKFYNKLIKFMGDNNYQHYEISNFALKDFYSKHNTNYWKNIPYIGFGPSAHSYDDKYRHWNISSVKKYIENINLDKTYYELEKLSVKDKFNEYLITGLRTEWGCNLNYIKTHFGKQFYFNTLKVLKSLQSGGNIYFKNSNFNLLEKHLIQSDFFIEKFIL